MNQNMHVNNFRKESGLVMKLSIATLMGVLQSGPAFADTPGMEARNTFAVIASLLDWIRG